MTLTLDDYEFLQHITGKFTREAGRFLISTALAQELRKQNSPEEFDKRFYLDIKSTTYTTHEDYCWLWYRDAYERDCAIWARIKAEEELERSENLKKENLSKTSLKEQTLSTPTRRKIKKDMTHVAQQDEIFKALMKGLF